MFDKERLAAARTRRQYDTSLRATILDGDVLLFSGWTPLSTLIRLFTRSRYSHVGLTLWWEERLIAVEAVGSGVRAWPLSECVRHYDGRVTLFRATPLVRERLDTTRFRQEATAYLGRRYAWWNLFRLAWYLIVQRPRGGMDPTKAPREFICSSLVSRCFKRANVDLVPESRDDLTTPADIARSELLSPVGALEPSRGAAVAGAAHEPKEGIDGTA